MASIEKNVVLHIGMPKAASTFLQEAVFARHKELLPIGRNVDQFLPQNQDLASLLCDSTDEQLDRCLETVTGILNKELIRVEKRRPIWSNETFATGRGIVPSQVVASRLGLCFQKATILLIIRNPMTALVATYLQACRSQKMLPFNPWFTQEMATSGGVFSWYEFDRVIAEYEAVFGANSVKVIPFEALVQRPEWFTAQLASVLNLSQESLLPLIRQKSMNRAPSSLELRLRAIQRMMPLPENTKVLLANWMKPYFNRIFQKGSSIEISLTDDQKAHLEERFSSVHRWLEEKYLLPLGSMGYAV